LEGDVEEGFGDTRVGELLSVRANLVPGANGNGSSGIGNWRVGPRDQAAHHELERVRVATDALSTVLFNQYVLPFEIVSVMLLAAVIGGVFLAKREPGGPS